MRPKSIKNFDLTYLGSIAISVLGFILNYDVFLAQVQGEMAQSGMEVGSGFAIGTFAFGTAISLAIWFLISILRIVIIKWVLVFFFVIGLFGLPAAASQAMSITGIIGIATMVLQALAIYFLFRPDAKAWFAEKRGGGGE